MATHGRSGIKRWAMGSTTDKVLRATTQPLLLIRATSPQPLHHEGSMLNKILVPLDGSQEAEAVIPHVEEIASIVRAEVFLLRVIPVHYETITVQGYDYTIYPEQQMESDKVRAKDYLHLVCSRMKQKGINAKYEVCFGDAADQIIKTANDTQTHLVAMSTHGRSGISRLFLGSVADRVLQAGTTPLLLARAASVLQGEEIPAMASAE